MNDTSELFESCLFRDSEPIEPRVEVEGCLNRFGFHPERLEAARGEVAEMLALLPDEFQQAKGGGMSFLNACMDRNGNHWAEHRTIDNLVTLGLGLKLVKYCLPRDMWKILPDGMPYFTVLTPQSENITEENSK